MHDVTHLRKDTGMGVSGCPLFNGIGDLIKGTLGAPSSAFIARYWPFHLSRTYLYSAESLFKETLCPFASFLSHSGGIL